jgi:hypothetical protein
MSSGTTSALPLVMPDALSAGWLTGLPRDGPGRPAGQGENSPKKNFAHWPPEPGRDAFYRVPIFAPAVGDAVECVPSSSGGEVTPKIGANRCVLTPGVFMRSGGPMGCGIHGEASASAHPDGGFRPSELLRSLRSAATGTFRPSPLSVRLKTASSAPELRFFMRRSPATGRSCVLVASSKRARCAGGWRRYASHNARPSSHFCKPGHRARILLFWTPWL